MQMLKDAILERGKALNQDVLLVDSFLNHQVDVALMEEIGEEFAKYFAGRGITRVVTIESSGIAPASFTALAPGSAVGYHEKADFPHSERGSASDNCPLFHKGHAV